MKFHSQLETIPTGRSEGGRQIDRLTAPLTFSGSNGSFVLRVVVPSGFETDYASTPRFLWWLVPPRGPYSRATVAHDCLCRDKGCPRFLADAVFRVAMQALDVPWWQWIPMYYAVRAYSIFWRLT